MSNDVARLMNDVNVVTSVLSPDVDEVKMMLRLEEVLSNYEIHRKSTKKLGNDFEENIELYTAAKRIEGLSEITLKGFLYELKAFSNYVNKPTIQINTADIRKYLASNDRWMMSTVGSKLSKIKSFFGWAVEEEILLRNPASKIKPPKLPQRLPKSLSIRQLEIVRDSCITLRERALVEVGYSTAARVSELASMKISDVNFQNMSIRIIGKGNKEDYVYLSDKAMYHLEKYLNQRKESVKGKSNYLFIGERRPFRDLTPGAVESIVDKIEQRTDISKKLTPHVLRHSFATLAMENHADLADVQSILRHKNPNTTLVYAQVSEERKKQAHKRFHVQ